MPVGQETDINLDEIQTILENTEVTNSPEAIREAFKEKGLNVSKQVSSNIKKLTDENTPNAVIAKYAAHSSARHEELRELNVNRSRLIKAGPKANEQLAQTQRKIDAIHAGNQKAHTEIATGNKIDFLAKAVASEKDTLDKPLEIPKLTAKAKDRHERLLSRKKTKVGSGPHDVKQLKREVKAKKEELSDVNLNIKSLEEKIKATAPSNTESEGLEDNKRAIDSQLDSIPESSTPEQDTSKILLNNQKELLAELEANLDKHLDNIKNNNDTTETRVKLEDTKNKLENNSKEMQAQLNNLTKLDDAHKNPKLEETYILAIELKNYSLKQADTQVDKTKNTAELKSLSSNKKSLEKEINQKTKLVNLILPPKPPKIGKKKKPEPGAAERIAIHSEKLHRGLKGLNPTNPGEALAYVLVALVKMIIAALISALKAIFQAMAGLTAGIAGVTAKAIGSKKTGDKLLKFAGNQLKNSAVNTAKLGSALLLGVPGAVVGHVLYKKKKEAKVDLNIKAEKDKPTPPKTTEASPSPTANVPAANTATPSPTVSVPTTPVPETPSPANVAAAQPGPGTSSPASVPTTRAPSVNPTASVSAPQEAELVNRQTLAAIALEEVTGGTRNNESDESIARAALKVGGGDSGDRQQPTSITAAANVLHDQLVNSPASPSATIGLDPNQTLGTNSTTPTTAPDLPTESDSRRPSP